MELLILLLSTEQVLLDANDLLLLALELYFEFLNIGVARLLGLLLLLDLFVETFELLLALTLQDGHSEILLLEPGHLKFLLSYQIHELLFKLIQLVFLRASI